MPRDPFVVPPGGFAAYNQMTPASKAAYRLPHSGIPRKRKKKSAAKKRAKRKPRNLGGTKYGTSRKVGPKFGSPAWHKKYKTGKFRKK